MQERFDKLGARVKAAEPVEDTPANHSSSIRQSAVLDSRDENFGRSGQAGAD